MIDFSEIKCIVWDLDNTLWDGVLAEQDNVKLCNNNEVLFYSTEVGVVNTICSKNDLEVVKRMLVKLEIEDYFVFSSINKEAKGPRLKNQIESMKLRNENVLFIDDELSNLREASFCNPGIMVSQPYIVEELCIYFKNLYISGKRKNRLTYYKQLETKNSIAKQYSSNEEFLKDSNIQVKIDSNINSAFQRIYELSQRTYQLNFTKQRISEDDLKKEILESDCAACIRVKDKYGDMGIVGYYIFNKGKLVHFVFSCRVIGMGIEQYVYAKIGRPYLSVVGDVASDLYLCDRITWINEWRDEDSIMGITTSLKVLFKGSCDFRRMQLLLPTNVKYEVPYMRGGKNVVYQTGIPTMAMTIKYSTSEIHKMASRLPFYLDEYYNTEVFEVENDIVFLSTISLANLGVYKHKYKDFFVSMGLPNAPMYMPENEHLYKNQGKFANGFDNNKESFEYLRDNYEYINDIYVKKYFKGHLKLIINSIKARKLYIILGNEEKYSITKTKAGELFVEANRIIYDMADKYNFSIINISDYIMGKEDVMPHFNHFCSRVYYKLAKRINEIIEERENE